MTAKNRIGTALLLAWAVALAGLMGYTLVGVGTEPAAPPAAPARSAEVVAIFPDREDWRNFRQGIVACRRKGRLNVVHEDENAVVISTPRHGRTVRFAWAPARGVLETRQEVRRRIESPSPPLAFVGSTNTALTAALADELHAGGGDSAFAPVLLIPSATAVHAVPGEGRKPETLLAMHPGRSFRFCPNNRREADLVVGCLATLRPRVKPSRVFVVVDPADPYSVDLADCFEKAIENLAPKVEIITFRDVVAHAGTDDQPTEEDDLWAEGVARSLVPEARTRPSWIVLPLQSEPSRRLLRALRAAIHAILPADAPPIEVLCGDGIGLTTLSELAGNPALSVWCASGASHHEPFPDAPQEVQVSAEVVAAIASALDREGPLTPETLRAHLTVLDLAADAPAALGRALGFTPDGERKGESLGRVFHAGPAQADILSFAKARSGSWSEPTRIRPPPSEARR